MATLKERFNDPKTVTVIGVLAGFVLSLGAMEFFDFRFNMGILMMAVFIVTYFVRKKKKSTENIQS